VREGGEEGEQQRERGMGDWYERTSGWRSGKRGRVAGRVGGD
jgi:hypothetical protein